MNGCNGRSRHLTAEMLYYMFDAANMHRWNDHYRPVDFTELDKQAHKATIAWYLAKYEEDAGKKIDWKLMIEHSLFAFIQRIAITDLKPPVYHELIQDRENRKSLNEFVLDTFKRQVSSMDPGFMDRFRNYIENDWDSLEDRIISTAHYLATKYEFDILESSNSFVLDIAETKEQINGQLRKFRSYGLEGMKDAESLENFIRLVGQLRCQQRWAKAPRVPKTTVLGHCIFVANSAYLNDLDHPDVSEKRVYNDFYTGLFHDLPEVLTKDVITPVKTCSDSFNELLGKIEKEMFRKKVEKRVPRGWLPELRAMALNPFVYDDGMPDREFDSVKACDNLAAWIEAFVSIRYGISSKALRDGKVQIGNKLVNEGKGEKIGAAKIMIDFENMEI